MSAIGHALARLAHRIGGQLMMELPDDVEPFFVAGLLEGANKEVATDPPFALFVREKRQDADGIRPSVDFRELAMYRQGSHLALAFASDNRGMSTYSSVYPLLLSNGFPSADGATGGTGVAALPEFASTLAEVLAERHGTLSLDQSQFTEVTRYILSFLAEAYEAVGNGQASFATDWWMHVQQWTDALQLASILEQGPVGVSALYGCAGLPAPIDGLHLTMTPRQYVKVLQDRWSTPLAIGSEVDRLTNLETASRAAAQLGKIDWDESFERTSLRSDSIVALVALGGASDTRERIAGWATLSEVDFKDSYVDAKGKLRILRRGLELQSPWKNAPAVLVATASEPMDAQGNSLELAGVELVVPLDPRTQQDAQLASLSKVAPSISIRGTRGCKASFKVESENLLPDGLHLKGTLSLTFAKRSRNSASIEVTTSGDASPYLVDRCDATFLVIRADEAALWVKAQGRTTKSSLRGPVVWSGSDGNSVAVGLPKPGAYELAVAWGESTGWTKDGVLARNTPLNIPWVGLEECGAKAALETSEPAEVTYRGNALFQLELVKNDERPLSPIVAAASGLQADASALVHDGTFGFLEAQLGECLAHLSDGCFLGTVLASESRSKSGLMPRNEGIYCTPDLATRTGRELFPGVPSNDLLALPSYVKLRKAYAALKLPDIISSAEEDGGPGLTISRVMLDAIPQQAIDELLQAYRELLDACVALSSSDGFWARNPFSVAVFPEGSGYQAASAVLLSPLHPVRLAWLWALHVGLRQAYDDGAAAAESLALLDGTNFPAFVEYKDQFESACALMPVRIDARPGDLYLGWHASVAIVNKQVAMPAWIAGRPFPTDGLSALSSASIKGAIDDFLRVSPQVQALHIELTGTTPSLRSSSIDEGLLSKIRELAEGSLGLDGVAGVRVADSETRVGPIPSLGPISDTLAMARPGFNVEWTNLPSGKSSPSHVTFVEGNAALLSMEPAKASGCNWLAELPLRRTPVRVRAPTFTTLDYSLAAPNAEAGEFEKAIFDYESLGGDRYALKMIPNPVGVAGKPGWLVAGDFGVDPRGISRAARDQSGSDYILWDWRPATTTKPDRELSNRAQPYFVLASVPPALNNAFHLRLKQLNAELSEPEVHRRTRLMVSTLAERAVGLNTLLSIGHHQATGALGFFFALQSMETWLASSPSEEIRLVIPVDAVDPFLRASTNSASDSRKRADLLAVRAFISDHASPTVVLVPVEIKHYGLAAGEKESAFPLAGEPRLNEHAEQLQAYQAQLQTLCEAYEQAAGSHASLLGQRLAAVLDAALQLGPRYDPSAARLLAAVASGRAQVTLGKGVLLWYQPGGSGFDGAKAFWDEVPASAAHIRNDVRVDPRAFDGCFWAEKEGLAHQVVREALEDASHIESAGSVETDDSKTHVPAPHEPPSPATVEPVVPGPAPTQDENLAPHVDHPSEQSPKGQAPATTTTSSGPTRQKMPPSELEKRYAAILAAFGEFNVKVERPRGEVPYQEGPAFIEYAVFPSYGVSVNKIESQLQNLKLRLKLSSDAEIGCSTHHGNVILTVPKADEERYFVDAEDLWNRWTRPRSGFRIPVGEDAAGDIVELDLSNSNSPHLLIAGVTGSGKSEALLTILHGAARYYTPDELRFRLIDPKQTELNTLEDLPHTEGGIGWSGEEAISLLEQAVAEMEERYKLFRQAGPTIRNISEFQASAGAMPRWIIVLDEYADLISDDTERKQIEKCLQRLSQKARAAGLHVIVSTQKPVVQVVNTVVKGNLPGKIALKVNTSIESKVILDETGAERLVGKGDALIRAGSGLTRTQFARYAI